MLCLKNNDSWEEEIDIDYRWWLVRWIPYEESSETAVEAIDEVVFDLLNKNCEKLHLATCRKKSLKAVFFYKAVIFNFV